MDMVKSLCMCTLFLSHDTCVWSDIPRGLGTRAVILKPLAKACQIRSDVSIIFITSPKPESASCPFDCLAFQFPFPSPFSL